MIVTFDLFSAATDTRTGASRTFARYAAQRGWSVSGEEIYDVWDGHNKALQRTARPPTTFTDLSREALRRAYGDLGVDPGRAAADLVELHAGVCDWPLWPDVEDGIGAVAARARVGLLSNVDTGLARRTRAGGLVDPDLILSSQRLGAFKPDPAIYHAAVSAVAPAPLVHVAASARDVRGAVEAGITVIRLVRPGHRLDPDGPAPRHQIEHATDLGPALDRLAE